MLESYFRQPWQNLNDVFDSGRIVQTKWRWVCSVSQLLSQRKKWVVSTDVV